MKITIHKHKTKAIKEFSDTEFEIWDKKHFGKDIKWEKHIYYLKVKDKSEIVGTLGLEVEAKVGFIKTIIVKHSRLRQGIGKLLINQAEKLTKKHQGHKLYLFTGKNWQAVEFYSSMGFKKTCDLPNHFFNKDFILMTKFFS